MTKYKEGGNKMKEITGVFGSSEQAKELIVGKDTIYVHTNIKKLESDAEGKPAENLYSYDEIQYTKDEYIKLISEKNAALAEEVTNTQMALCEVYELLA